MQVKSIVPKILLLAGEESGLLYARRIEAELKSRLPSVEIRGYGDYGFKVSDLAVMGVEQVLAKIFYFLRVRRTMERAIAAWRPDVVCTIDYPGMNLRLAAFAKAHGIRTVHVVCPQVWAWHQNRIPKIEATIDRLCCFFPFEPALFKPGFAEFVGHPLLDEFKAIPRVPHEGKLLAVLPGSRMGEIEKHMPTLLEVLRTLFAADAKLAVTIPAANAHAFERISQFLSRLEPAFAARCRLQQGGARELLCQADAAIVASGTATLEAALANCPTVLVYRVGWFFAMVCRHVIKGVKHIGLANVIAEKASRECPMVEFLQENLTAENVLREIKPLLFDEKANETARLKLAETMTLLRSNGTAISKIGLTLIGNL